MSGLREQILNENVKLHRVEAAWYDRIHPEEFNWFEQRRIAADLRFFRERIPQEHPCFLDIGCGTGNLFLKLLGSGCRVWGVDISPEMIAVLRGKIPAADAARADLTVQPVDEYLEACTVRFDGIVASSVLHHLPDYLQTLRTALGLLKPGGWIYLTHEPTKEALSPDPFLRKVLWQADNLLYSLFFGRGVPQLEARNYRLSDYHLYHQFDQDLVARQCRDCGVRVERLSLYSSAMRLGISCWVDSVLIGSKRQFSLIGQKQ